MQNWYMEQTCEMSLNTKCAKIRETALHYFFHFVSASHNGAYVSKRESSLALIYSLSPSPFSPEMCEILGARLESYHVLVQPACKL